VLAKNIYFQFADAACTVDKLEGAAAGLSSLEELSQILSEVNEDKLLGTRCTLNLLRALGHVDPNSVEHGEAVKQMAALPPQDDPKLELDRLMTIGIEASYTLLFNVVERRQPVLSKSSVKSDNPVDDLQRLNSMIRPLHTDPVRLHASGLAELICGMGYDFIMDRMKDLTDGAGRQLQGVGNAASGLLASVSNASAVARPAVRKTKQYV
jgi:hypothetical protein